MTDNQNPARQTNLRDAFEVGDEVVCIDNSYPCGSLVIGQTYKVRHVSVTALGCASIGLVGIGNPGCADWHASRFQIAPSHVSNVVAAWRYRYEPHLTWHVAEFVDQLPRKELFPLLQIEALYAEPPAPEPQTWGEMQAEDCVLSIGSQRVCGHGTLGCVNHHAPSPSPHLVGPWSIAPADPWHVENWQASAYSTVGIARDGEVKALAVSTGETDEGDYIVAALNFYAQRGGQP